MDLVPIIDWIERETDLVKAADLFNYSMPPTVSKGVLLVLDPGESEIDHEIPGRDRAKFQIIVRDPDYDSAMARANELFKLLRTEGTLDFGDFCTSYIRPINKPLPFRRLEGDEMEVSVNFETLYWEVP